MRRGVAGALAAALLTVPAGWRHASITRDTTTRAFLGSDSTLKIAFDTDEGTFTNLDVSPDGKTIIFDLLGDIYTLPIAGGNARSLIAGPSWDRAPRFSPSGRQISFLGDRDGNATCVWLADASGANVRAVVAQFESNAKPGCGRRGASGTPEWTPDGRQISFASSDTLYDNVRVYLADVASGAVKRLDNMPATLRTPAREIRLLATSATYSVDGRRAYLSEAGRSVCYAPLQQCGYMPPRSWIYEVDRSSGARRLLTDTVPGRNEFRPHLSRDGRRLAYLRRDADGRSALRIRDLATGSDRQLTIVENAADPYRWGDRSDAYPSFAFTPDGRSIVIWIAGKIHRVSLVDGARSMIPMRVRVEREAHPSLRADLRLPDGDLRVRAVRWPVIAPDDRTLVFSAVGYLWRRNLSSGKTMRITTGEGQFEYMPALSPDGHLVAYTEYSALGGPGRLMVASMADGKRSLVLESPTTFYMPSWSPDGRRIAFLQAKVSERGDTTGHYGWVDLRTREVRMVMPAARPGRDMPYSQTLTFSSDGEKLLMTDAALWQGVRLMSANVDGTELRTLAVGGREVRGVLPAPDLSHLVLIDGNSDAWIRRFEPGSADTTLSFQAPGMRRIESQGVAFPSWRGSNELTFSFANVVSRFRVGEAAPVVVDTVDLRVPRREGSGLTAFRGARIITVDGNAGAGRVIESGTLVVRGRRIAAVGEVASTPVPPDARVVDARGLTIFPGLVDAHYHSVGRHAGMTPFAAHGLGDPTAIAYGVTTGWDAVNHGYEMSLALAELREAGRVIGPRWFSAGHGVSPSEIQPIGSPDDARSVVSRNRAMGVQLLKDYSTVTARHRRWLVDAARDAGVAIASHAAVNGGVNDVLQRAAEGYTAVEHMYTSVPFYRDARELIKRTGLIYTPNLLISDGTSSESWSAAPPMFDEIRARGETHRRKLEKFAGSFIRAQIANGRLAESGSIRHAGTDVATPFFELTSRAIASLAKDGGIVALGAHNDPAVLTHLELWMLSRGGLPPGDVIRAATMSSAIKLGYARDIGSIEIGKIADFLVVTGNPLEDIRHTVDLEYTVADGIVYNATTLEPLDGSGRARTKRVALPDSVERMVERLPPATKMAARRYVDDTDSLARRAWLVLRTDPAALRFVMAVLPLEPDPLMRRNLIGILQLQGDSAGDDVNRSLVERVRMDPDSVVIVAAARALRTMALRRAGLAQALATRIKEDRERGDTILLPLLLEAEEGYVHDERDIDAPAFVRTPGPPFRVPVRGTLPLRVLAFGDYGTAHLTGAQFHQAKLAGVIRAYHATRPFTFGITTGDNFYPTSFPSPSDARWQTAWESQYGQLGIRFFPSLGNHDWAQPAGPLSEALYSTTSASWSFPSFYYTYTAGAAQFFAVNTNALTERQLTWLRKELERSPARWKIVYGHFPVYEQTDYTVERQRELLLPVLAKYKVDVYLAGHHHSLQHWQLDGIDYVVTGAGGAGTYALGDTTRSSTGRRYIASRPGFAELEISQASLGLRFVGMSESESGRRPEAVVLYRYKRTK